MPDWFRMPTMTITTDTQRSSAQDGAMSNTKNPSNGPQLRSGPMITGAALVGAGALLALAGIAVGGSHLLSATRRWVREMDVPPSELARLKWAQAKAAALAGAGAWQNGASAHQETNS
jgi:hypothetical protein